MAKTRELVKRRKAVRNIRKITRTMELIATARFKKALDRAVEAEAYTRKIAELAADLSASAAGAYLHVGEASALAQATLLGVLFILAALPSCFLWLAGGAAMQRVLHAERARRGFHLAMGALLAASVILFLR